MTKPLERAPSLIPDGIENPKNARALLDAASMFGCPVAFRDTLGLVERWDETEGGGPLPTASTQEILSTERNLVALENGPGSASLFGATPLRDGGSIVVGNERRGVGRDLLAGADRVLHIPSAVRAPNTLNVAAAAAVGLYFLCGRRAGDARQVRDPERRVLPSSCLLRRIMSKQGAHFVRPPL